jgi:hypothetical protein
MRKVLPEVRRWMEAPAGAPAATKAHTAVARLAPMPGD